MYDVYIPWTLFKCRVKVSLSIHWLGTIPCDCIFTIILMLILQNKDNTFQSEKSFISIYSLCMKFPKKSVIFLKFINMIDQNKCLSFLLCMCQMSFLWQTQNSCELLFNLPSFYKSLLWNGQYFKLFLGGDVIEFHLFFKV